MIFETSSWVPSMVIVAPVVVLIVAFGIIDLIYLRTIDYYCTPQSLAIQHPLIDEATNANRRRTLTIRRRSFLITRRRRKSLVLLKTLARIPWSGWCIDPI